MKTQPKISVIMPVRNGMPYLPAAISSVLDSSGVAVELVVVDDGSTDGTRQFLEGLRDGRVKVFDAPEAYGIATALNFAVSKCSADYIARMDADDVSYPGRLLRQWQLLAASPTIGVVGGQIRAIGPDGKARVVPRLPYPSTPSHVAWSMLLQSPVSHPAVMIRRKALDAVGGYQSVRPHTEDFDLWARIIVAGWQITNLREKVLEQRFHGANLSHVLRAEFNAEAVEIAQEYACEAAGRSLSREVVRILRRLELAEDVDTLQRAVAAARAYTTAIAKRARLQGHERRSLYRFAESHLVRLSAKHLAAGRVHPHDLPQQLLAHGISGIGMATLDGIRSRLQPLFDMAPVHRRPEEDG